MTYQTAMENKYNKSFYELVDYAQNVEVYLAKALISKDSEHEAKTLTHLWREASVAQSHLSGLPIASNELENTSTFYLGEDGNLYIIYAYGNNEFTNEMDIIVI